jgi:hypothetical protein
MTYFERLSRSGEPPGLVSRIVAFVVTVALVGVALMFSVVLFAVVLTVGMVAWGYLWWRTRELRRQMREHPPGGIVIEGEVIREVDPRERQEP